MPLLMCPNDNSSMTTAERSGVQFDMCPTCRGVWLDRGELEKLMEGARSEGGRVEYPPRSYPAAPVAPAAPGYGYPGERGERGEGGEWGEQGERGHYGHGRHRKRSSIFDIFD